MREFLDYIRTDDESAIKDSGLAQVAAAYTNKVRENEERVSQLLTMEMYIREARAEAEAEGRAEGAMGEFLRLIKRLYEKGKSLAEMVDLSERTEEEVINALTQLNLPIRR